MCTSNTNLNSFPFILSYPIAQKSLTKTGDRKLTQHFWYRFYADTATYFIGADIILDSIKNQQFPGNNSQFVTTHSIYTSSHVISVFTLQKYYLKRPSENKNGHNINLNCTNKCYKNNKKTIRQSSIRLCLKQLGFTKNNNI